MSRPIKMERRGGEDSGLRCATGGWIKGAIKHPGSFTKSAERAGESTHAFAEKKKHASGKTGARARLALTLEKMHK